MLIRRKNNESSYSKMKNQNIQYTEYNIKYLSEIFIFTKFLKQDYSNFK